MRVNFVAAIVLLLPSSMFPLRKLFRELASYRRKYTGVITRDISHFARRAACSPATFAAREREREGKAKNPRTFSDNDGKKIAHMPPIPRLVLRV
ncbi:hypothetical protein PUN28_011078 [Cardiocondyla obscurior]|uniref:Secreted protein n=1 Tax=Cardiocondyla obscurior TaxID=286306 RepID=A0AAW2FPB2_9HYME